MSPLSRILWVQDTSADWTSAAEPLGTGELWSQVRVVEDHDAALALLQARSGLGRQRASLPAVVLLGPHRQVERSLRLLAEIRRHPKLHRVPVLWVADQPASPLLRRAYELGANGVVAKSHDARVNAARLQAIWLFWVTANVPPPGCLRRQDVEERERA